MDKDTKCIGIKITPEGYDMFFREGFSCKLIANAVPDRFKMFNYGYDYINDCFYFLFATEDCPEGMSVQEWIIPTYERIYSDKV